MHFGYVGTAFKGLAPRDTLEGGFDTPIFGQETCAAYVRKLMTCWKICNFVMGVFKF